jgi:hypothetical protein
MRRILLFLVTCLVFLYLPAQSLFQDAGKDIEVSENQQPVLQLNGYVRGVVFGGGEKYELATSFAEIALQPQLRSHGAFLQADIRLRKGVFFDEDIQLIDIAELYAGYSGAKFDLMLGNQIVSWGRTDGFNPTNNITPKDYFLFTPDPDDQLSSNFLLRAKYRFTPAIELDVIGIPYYQPSVYKYELFDMGDNVSFAGQQLPERQLKNGAVAARLNFDLPVAGWSVSYFRGYDPFHGFDVVAVDWSAGSPVITNRAETYRKTTWGADVAVPLGGVIVRAEGAYNITDNPDEKMYIPMSDFSYVAALETNIGGITTIAQYVGKYVPGFSALVQPVLTDPLNPLAQMQYANAMIDYESRSFNRRIFHQQEKMNHAVSLTLTKSVGYDAWDLMCSGYYDITTDEWLVQPKLTYKINDALTASVGGNYMHGSGNTLFGYASTIMNGAFIGLKASF